MGGCAVHGCSNHSRNKIRMFRFPTDPERRKTWIANCRRTEQSIPKAAYICVVHFDDQQFEQHREDGWKKLKPNAVPTLFPETDQKTRAPKSSPKRKKLSQKKEVSVKKTVIKTSSKKEKSAKKKKLTKKKSKADKTFVPKGSKSLTCDSDQKKSLKVLYRISGGIVTGTSENSQKENVLPRLRKSQRPCKLVFSTDSESSEKDDDEEMEDMEEIDEVVKEYKDTAAERQITIFKREIETLKQDVAEFEKHNKSMSQVIVELEKHNKLMGIKIVELEKENKVLTFKIGDLEKLNEDLKSKLDCCFTEEQLARMDKMKQLGTIERYIPALHQ